MEEKYTLLQIQQIAHELSLNDDELQKYAENFGLNVPQYRHYLWLRYKTENEKLGPFYLCQPESHKSKRVWLSFVAAILAICCIGLSVFCYYNGKSIYQKGEAAGYEQGVADTKSKYSASNSSGVKVYVTPSGSRYHEKGCDHLSKSKAFQISLKEAKESGYTACSKCNPPK